MAVNNVNPAFGDGHLRTDDNAWGWGVNLGLLCEIDAATRFGVTWNSQVSPLLPLNSAWRFGVGAQHQASETFFWGVAVEYL